MAAIDPWTIATELNTACSKTESPYRPSPVTVMSMQVVSLMAAASAGKMRTAMSCPPSELLELNHRNALVAMTESTVLNRALATTQP